MKFLVQDSDFWPALYARVQEVDENVRRSAYETVKSCVKAKKPRD